MCTKKLQLLKASSVYVIYADENIPELEIEGISQKWNKVYSKGSHPVFGTSYFLYRLAFCRRFLCHQQFIVTPDVIFTEYPHFMANNARMTSLLILEVLHDIGITFLF